MKINWTIGRRLTATFSVLFVIQIILGVVAYDGIVRSGRNFNTVTRTIQVNADISGVLTALDDAETGERGYLITGEDSYLEPYQAARKVIDPATRDLREATADNPNQQRLLDMLDPAIATKLAGLEATIDLRKGASFEVARQAVLTGAGKKTMDDIRKVLADMTDEENALLKKRRAASEAAVRTLVVTIVVGALVAAIFIVVAAVALTRSIARPLGAITKVAQRIAAGDLSGNIAASERTDEMGVMLQAFRKMVENLRRTIADLGEGIAVLTSSASEILAGTTQVAAGASESAAAISETTTTVEEVRQAARLSSEKAKAVADNAQHVAQVSQSGQKAVEENAAGMLNIRKQVESIAQAIIRLSEQSQLIGGITAAVTDLADQSNVLAVNAAIEAARAGEQGKGFAVVAQEIRSLAEQSKQATTQVRALLNDVQKATSAVVMATEQGTKAVEAGVEQSTLAGEAIRALAESTSEATQTAIQIVASSQQQVVGMDQIGTAMQSISQAGTQTAASMRQSETSARNLHELGLKLKQLVAQYQV